MRRSAAPGHQGVDTVHTIHLKPRSRPLWLWAFLLALLSTLSACWWDGNPGDPAPSISVQPLDSSATVGNSATLSVNASGAGLSYQWQVSTDGGNTWADVPGATQASYTTPVTTLADHGKRYRVVVSGSGITVTSSAVTLTVTAAVVAPAITVQPGAQSVTAPAAASFSVTATGTALAYQWQRSTDNGSTWGDAAGVGATSASYSTGATDVAMHGQQFRVIVGNSAGSVTSTAALLSVSEAAAAPAITGHPASQSVTVGSATVFTVIATGTPAPTLQWQRSTDGGSTWADINSATATTYNTGATVLTQNGERYRAVASNSAGSATSNSALLSVNAAAVLPAFSAHPQNVSVTEGQNAQLSVTVSGTPTPTLQWQLSTDNGGTWGNINAATGTTYDIVAPALASNGRQFRVAATNSAGTVNSNAAVLTVTAAPPVGKSWQAPVQIGGDLAGGVQIAVNAQGEAMAVWSQGLVVMARRYTVAGGWGVATEIGADGAPQVAIDNNGNAVAVWAGNDAGGFRHIFANSYTVGSGWAGAIQLETAYPGSDNPQVAMDGSGSAIAVWSNGVVVASRYVVGTGWSTAAPIARGFMPQLASAANGDSVVVWADLASDGVNYVHYGTHYSAATGTWDSIAPISGAMPFVLGLHVAIDGVGNAIALWNQRGVSGYVDVVANRYSAATRTWGSAEPLETDDANHAIEPRVAVNVNGEAFAIWLQSAGTAGGSAGGRVISSRYTPGAGWGAATAITTNSPYPGPPRIAIDSAGNATAVWAQRGAVIDEIWANRLNTGSGWGTAQRIETGTSSSINPQVGVDGNGNAIAVWNAGAGINRGLNIWSGVFK
jgi:Immunoglobulin I-set domain